MESFWATRLAELLANERTLLDKAFGTKMYNFEDVNRDSAIIHSSSVVCHFTFDRRRDRSLSNRITFRGDNWEWTDESTFWLMCIDRKMPERPRDRDGRISLRVEDQLETEIKYLTLLQDFLFSDAQKARDASQYLQGYSKAYNDYCEGKWDSD
jgi:hypothetical protein